MAAIIAQMTRANRERQKSRRIDIAKCMYHLPPFDSHFEPVIHNKYLRCKKSSRETFRSVRFHKLVLGRLEEIMEEAESRRVFCYKTFVCEAVIIAVSMLVVPLLLFVVLVFWPSQQVEIIDRIPLSSLGNETISDLVN